MRVDTANRSVAGLVAASLLTGVLVFCGAVGCVLVAVIVARLARDGPDALTSGSHGVWAALVFIAVVTVGAVLGGLSVRRQLRASSVLTRHVRELELPLPPELAAAAERARLAGRVQLVDAGECFSFAYGTLTPRVAVSRGLLEAVSAAELDAVLAHEAYHVRNLDPLKVLLTRALPRTFFFAPALAGLHRRYLAARELAADRRAVARCGRSPLAAALLKVVGGPGWAELGGAAAIGGPELLDARIAQLERGAEPPISVPTRTAIVVSFLGALALTGLFIAAVAGFGGTSAVADATGMQVGPLAAVAGGAFCAAPWLLGAWLAYQWLARRTRRPLDTLE